MSTITTKETSKTKILPDSNNWKTNVDTFTGDDLLDAYLQGKEAGKDEYKRILMQQLKANFDIATSVSEATFNLIKEHGICLKAIHLKADTISKFEVLFVADEKDFIEDKFRDAFVIARSKKCEVENENFYISFSFVPFSKHLSEDCIHADGFFMKYEK